MWQEYYKLPLKVDEYCTIITWTADMQRAFDWFINGALEQKKQIVNVINGTNYDRKFENQFYREGIHAWTADFYYTKFGKIEIKNTALDTLYPSCWSVGRLIEIINICSIWGNVSIHRTDREVTQIEQLIEILQNRINGKTIDLSKLEE